MTKMTKSEMLTTPVTAALKEAVVKRATELKIPATELTRAALEEFLAGASSGPAEAFLSSAGSSSTPPSSLSSSYEPAEDAPRGSLKEARVEIELLRAEVKTLKTQLAARPAVQDQPAPASSSSSTSSKGPESSLSPKLRSSGPKTTPGSPKSTPRTQNSTKTAPRARAGGPSSTSSSSTSSSPARSYPKTQAECSHNFRQAGGFCPSCGHQR
jgi:hypothetical protein